MKNVKAAIIAMAFILTSLAVKADITVFGEGIVSSDPDSGWVTVVCTGSQSTCCVISTTRQSYTVRVGDKVFNAEELVQEGKTIKFR